MGIETVTDIMQEALMLVIKTSAPLLLTSLVLGLVVSIFQTVTSIQEQTLTFVPKMVGIFVMMMLIGHWMLGSMVGYMEELWNNFSLYIK